MVAAPVVTVQVPVSTVAGELAAMVNTLSLHLDCAAPATDTVGTTFVSVTVEVEVQLPLVMAHLKTAGLVVTVTALVLEVAVVMVAVPLTKFQAPVSPVEGAFAAMVNVDELHFV